ncbi:MAG: sigma-70 family RNA polymerase sigma factor [Proteobacteria bacterium]|nr:sigma-70 family RNA polymerase sigma factor [Pseudomonadota bacterium]
MPTIGTSLRRTSPETRQDPNGGRESDDSLLARIGKGGKGGKGNDRNAWTELVGRHLPPVTRYASYVLRDAARAEDVAQETFVRLMRKAPDWENGGATLRTWLFRVALNLCIDIKRSRKFEPIDTADMLPDPIGTEQTDARIDLERIVRGAIAALPERQQTAIVLVHYEGFSGTEAADALHITVDALESLLARGRRALRQSLAAFAPDLLPEFERD